jgi:hypothetical protein
MTYFVWKGIEATPGLTLWLDGNSKISGWYPKPNALSLPAPATCLGSTATCRAACYASSAATSIPDDLARKYAHNKRTIDRLLAAPDSRMCLEAAGQLGDWINQHCRDIGFRWHVSGDVFSADYAWWITEVCYESRDVQHWIYTRSLHLVPTLLDAPNLAVNISADKDNLGMARAVALDTAAHLTYLWTGEPLPELPPGTVLFPSYGQRARDGAPLPPPPHRAMICPGDYFGQSERMRCGVCVKCGNPKHEVSK